jgi:inosine-uridine nucleoside N-ribohydrolase
VARFANIRLMNPLPFILDTDIGDDVDDALALALTLNSPELELRGVTTVFGNAPRRAALAQHLLKVWKREDVPVFVGCSKPLLQPLEPRAGAQFQILESDVLEERTQHAMDFLIGESGANEDKAPETRLTIAAIGPLTNIALAIAKEPQLVSAARLVLMGGMWNAAALDFRAEWNLKSDPEAAATVFESGIEISMVGLDVTQRCVLEEKHLQKIAQQAQSSPRLGVLQKLIELWMRDSKRPPTLHDPLAILSLFDDCVMFEDKKIEVRLCGPARGTLGVLPLRPANARVAVNVDAPRAIELFMERILKL